MTKTESAREELNRIQAVTSASVIKGHPERLALAIDWAMTAPSMTAAEIVAAAQVALPDAAERAENSSAPAPPERRGLPDAQAVYAARRPHKENAK